MKKLLFMMMIASNLSATNRWQALEEIDEQVRARENMPARVYDVQVVNETERMESSAYDVWSEERSAVFSRLCFAYLNALRGKSNLQLLQLLPEAAGLIANYIKVTISNVEDFEETPDSIL